jgi:DeoR/GlpR family transcriptional regulator of sugar metabolism
MQQQEQVEWRRAKVLELMSKGEINQSEIARIMQVDRSTICRDVNYLRQQAKENIARYVDERLPEEYEKCLVGLNSILKEAWSMSQTENIKSDKIKALVLAKECYAMKLELLTNAAVVEDAIRFVAAHATPMGKTNSDNIIDIDEKISHKKQESIATTNSIF